MALPPGLQVDVLVSEPMGTLLVNERMLETYLYARDHFLKPGGAMYPVRGVGVGVILGWVSGSEFGAGFESVCGLQCTYSTPLALCLTRHLHMLPSLVAVCPPLFALLPQALGRIHAAAFSDVALYSELYHKATFWTSPNFYGVNLTNLHHPALEGYFSQVGGGRRAGGSGWIGSHPDHKGP